MSRSSLHSTLLVVLAIAVSGLLVAALSGTTSAQSNAPISESGKDIVMMRCSLAEDFATVSVQGSVDVGAKKGVPCPTNVALLTSKGFQSRFIATSDVDKGYFVMMLAR